MFGDVGDVALVWDAVHVDEAGEAERLGIGELGHQSATFGVADDREWFAATDVVKHGKGIAHISVPRVQLGVFGVAVAALVP